MKVGVPKETKNHEYRVGMTPAGVSALVAAGHQVRVQADAGERIGFSNTAYRAAGADIVDSAEEVYACPMIVKVKEPQPAEYPMLWEDQILFTYLHLAPDPGQTAALIDRGVIGIAYETVMDARGRLPLLIPMSEVAGRLSIQAGATALQMAHGGNGMLLGGVPGVPPAKVVVVGGGVVGTQAARMAMGLGADVTLLDNDLDRLRYLDDVYGPTLRTRYSEPAALGELTAAADLVVGAVLIPGKQAPKLITRQMVADMRPGSVLVDVAIDQGGCAETARPTTHAEPTYMVDEVVHYCVANMPGATARTSTLALTNATLPYVLHIAGRGVQESLSADTGLMAGLNVCHGHVTNAHVAEDLNHVYMDPHVALGKVATRASAAAI